MGRFALALGTHPISTDRVLDDNSVIRYSIMRRIPIVKIRRTSSVLKHGAYAMGLLQGEDPAAFEKLHKELVADYSPIRVLAEEAVWTMTRIVWRRRHMDTYSSA